MAGSSRVNAARSFSAIASFTDKVVKPMSGTTDFRVKGFSSSGLARGEKHRLAEERLIFVDRDPTIEGRIH